MTDHVSKLGKAIRSATKMPALALLVATSWSSHALAGSSPDSSVSPSRGVIPRGAPVDVATHLNIPWSVVYAGDEVLVSERNTANILAFRPGQTTRRVATVPGVTARLDGGLLGLAVLDKGGALWVYAYHSTATDNRIVRMPYTKGALGTAQTVLAGMPGGRGHNGGRIAFGPDGMLYATVGEAQNPALSQDLKSLGGKILRMTPEGAVPADNPIPGSVVYSLGHRNPQGLAWDDRGQLWAAEFGDKGWDELNRIEPGKNYGWPAVEGRGGNPAYVDPIVQWRTTEMGPSGLAYVDGTFFLAGLTGKRLWSVTFDGAGQPVTAQYYVGEYGRIRDVIKGPNGNLWFVTNKTDRRGDTPGPTDDRVLSVSLVPAAAR